MTKLSIDLEWYRDKDGYRLLEAVPPEPLKPGATLLSIDPGKPPQIQRRGGDLLPYRPLAEFENLLAPQFARVTDPRGLLGFIERFGPLTRDGLDPKGGDDVPDLLEHARAMRSLLYPTRIEATAFPQMLSPGNGIPLTRLDAVLTVNPVTGLPRIGLVVDTLLSALWLQLGQALQQGAAFPQCEYCGQLFEAGPGARKRSQARFCSDAHRIAFNSLKRSKGRHAHA